MNFIHHFQKLSRDARVPAVWIVACHSASHAEWMGQVHEFLGLKVGVVLNSMTSEERQEAYNCDITYVTNNELGFDYLRDNMVIYKEQMVLRGLEYAIIDEVDSVLIDEARTPLIISGQSGKSTALYEMCDLLARQMKRGDDVQELTSVPRVSSFPLFWG